MADYYSLIARAISGLDPGAPGESRRALYERARAALIQQLRSIQPALSELEITRERLSLEEAVRKVESEAAERARDARRGASSVSRGDNLGRAAAPTNQSARTFAEAPNKRYPDSLLTRSALEAQAAKAKAEADRRAKEEHLAKLFQIEEATREQDKIRRQQESQEAARVQRERAVLLARAQLAKVASPAPSLAPDGRLDAGPNPVYDEPNSSDDLPSLPLRQREVIKAILSDLPRNSPRYLKTSLQSYDDELKIRGAQPILGLLKDMFEIIAAAVGDPEAQDWLAPGLQKAFEKVAQNHHTLVSHFPLDPEREDIYAQTLVEENGATGHSLSEPFRHVAEAVQDANKAGLTTDDFVKVVDKMAEFAKIVSTLPLSQSQSASPYRSPEAATQILVVRPEDRVGDAGQPISSKKRILLSGLGFFERAYNLIGSTVTIGATPEGLALLHQLRETISALLKFLL
ncbi:MAG: hypothetical protein U1E61_19455 [Bradyrhizobium sp.]